MLLYETTNVAAVTFAPEGTYAGKVNFRYFEVFEVVSHPDAIAYQVVSAVAMDQATDAGVPVEASVIDVGESVKLAYGVDPPTVPASMTLVLDAEFFSYTRILKLSAVSVVATSGIAVEKPTVAVLIAHPIGDAELPCVPRSVFDEEVRTSK